MRNLVIIISLSSILLWSCKSKEKATESTKEEIKQEQVKETKPLVKATRITGVLKAQGITTYQYGTHTIKEGEKLYALRSDDVKLDDYVEKKVAVIVVKIAGYPVDGGPDYLKVLRIELIK